MKNLVLLAKMFGQFIELESSFVRSEDIKAIRKSEKGIEVITPYGTFKDNTDFDTFKEKVQLVLETLKMEEMSRPEPIREQPNPRIIELPTPALKQPQQVQPIMGPIEDRSEVVQLSGNGALGRLFDDDSLKVVNRQFIQILDMNGVKISSGGVGGSIIGKQISGIVYENGKFTLAAREYQGDKIRILFQVQKRGQNE